VPVHVCMHYLLESGSIACVCMYIECTYTGACLANWPCNQTCYSNAQRNYLWVVSVKYTRLHFYCPNGREAL
jgi:hypothetical protein